MMTIARIYRDGRDCIVDVDGQVYRGEKVSVNRLSDGRYSLRVYDPAFHWLPRTSARQYHNDHSMIVDGVEDRR